MTRSTLRRSLALAATLACAAGAVHADNRGAHDARYAVERALCTIFSQHDPHSAAAQRYCREETRAQDSRSFTVDEAALPFDALAGSTVEADRWWGVLDSGEGRAGYRIEVPKNWNGILVMYAHGYAGTGPMLTVSNPSIRRHLLEQGYAWAASSYSANYYDVRAGVEDTNALALAFNRIAKANGRPLPKPRKVYITGHSMGGHVTGAAIELETLLTARNKVRYDGAVPMCGVMGGSQLFNYFSAYQIAAQEFAGFPAQSYPMETWSSFAPQVRAALFTTFSSVPTAAGLQLREVVKQLTGGERPLFAQGFALTPLQEVVWGVFGSDGTVTGILNKDLPDTRRITYQLDNDPALSAEEQALNDRIYQRAGERGANRLRRDGLRWIPEIAGQFYVPVVSLHTLGDMYVPFSMEQIYRRNAIKHGSDRRLVQRAVRAPSHCDFTRAEEVAAFDAMVQWEQRGIKPAGDEVLDRATVADPAYGCRFTDNTIGADDSSTTALTRRFLVPACPAVQ